jgi:hypothetical protein
MILTTDTRKPGAKTVLSAVLDLDNSHYSKCFNHLLRSDPNYHRSDPNYHNYIQLHHYSTITHRSDPNYLCAGRTQL